MRSPVILLLLLIPPMLFGMAAFKQPKPSGMQGLMGLGTAKRLSSMDDPYPTNYTLEV